MSSGFQETDYGDIMTACAAEGMGVFAIRVFAGGALAGRAPSAHTRRTPFFPLALYERDQRRAAHAAALLGPARSLKADALRFAVGHPHVSAAIIGFRDPGEIEEASRWLKSGPLPQELHEALRRTAGEP
jgi:aryl-alcohol dehydrogenase-like predicted oxidoreductase